MLQRTKSPVISRLICLSALVLWASGCADAADLFAPYRANQGEDIARMLAWPHANYASPLDVGMVLGCPANDDGTLSPCEQCRVDAAVDEYRRGRVRYLLFSGNAAHSAFVEADVMGDAAVAAGLPAERVLREPRAMTTWQNVRFAKQIMKAHDLHSTLIISTADHLPRARRIALYYGLEDAQTDYRACDR